MLTDTEATSEADLQLPRTAVNMALWVDIFCPSWY